MAKFSTHLSLGKVAYGVTARTECDYHVITLTVGQIRVTETLPSARDYADDPCFKEEYMCTETGVGAGRIWTYGKDIFAAERDAQAGVASLEQRAYKQRAERDARLAEQRDAQEAADRREFERLQAKSAAA